jgi:hypothetical protein
VNGSDAWDEERLAHALAALPPAPEAWVRAAEILPLARRDLEGLVERCQVDAVLRERVLAGLEEALNSTSEPIRTEAQAIRDRLTGA